MIEMLATSNQGFRRYEDWLVDSVMDPFLMIVATLLMIAVALIPLLMIMAAIKEWIDRRKSLREDTRRRSANDGTGNSGLKVRWFGYWEDDSMTVECVSWGWDEENRTVWLRYRVTSRAAGQLHVPMLILAFQRGVNLKRTTSLGLVLLRGAEVTVEDRFELRDSASTVVFQLDRERVGRMEGANES